MFGLGMPELVIILVIIVIIFGAGKLPEIGSGLVKALRISKRPQKTKIKKRLKKKIKRTNSPIN